MINEEKTKLKDACLQATTMFSKAVHDCKHWPCLSRFEGSMNRSSRPKNLDCATPQNSRRAEFYQIEE